MKYILGILLGIIIASVGVVYAKSESIDYRLMRVGGLPPVYKFIDPDNGNVCYQTLGGYGISGISCVKE